MSPKEPEVPTQMRALVFRRYGSAEVLEEAQVDRPAATENRVVVRVRAASINPFDLHFMHGDPYLMRPMMGLGLRRPKKPQIPGSDMAGVVEAVGPEASGFRPGDEVFGTVGQGGFAESVAISAKGLARKPANLTFEQAAAVPMAATTALQAVRDIGALKAGQRVIVNGASGGVGSFAIQLARALGAAEVTGVCSGRNVELVRSLGADRVIDYTKEDFTRGSERWDLLIDTIGNHGTRAFARALTPTGTFVVVGGGGGGWLGPMRQVIGAKLMSPFLKPAVRLTIAHSNAADLDHLRGLIEAGKVRPAVDRVFAWAQAREALDYLETRHARGKVVVAIAG